MSLKRGSAGPTTRKHLAVSCPDVSSLATQHLCQAKEETPKFAFPWVCRIAWGMHEPAGERVLFWVPSVRTTPGAGDLLPGWATLLPDTWVAGSGGMWNSGHPALWQSTLENTKPLTDAVVRERIPGLCLVQCLTHIVGAEDTPCWVDEDPSVAQDWGRNYQCAFLLSGVTFPWKYSGSVVPRTVLLHSEPSSAFNMRNLSFSGCPSWLMPVLCMVEVGAHLFWSFWVQWRKRGAVQLRAGRALLGWSLLCFALR